jgi:hypothetical protein
MGGERKQQTPEDQDQALHFAATVHALPSQYANTWFVLPPVIVAPQVLVVESVTWLKVPSMPEVQVGSVANAPPPVILTDVRLKFPAPSLDASGSTVESAPLLPSMICPAVSVPAVCVTVPTARVEAQPITPVAVVKFKKLPVALQLGNAKMLGASSK